MNDLPFMVFRFLLFLLFVSAGTTGIDQVVVII